MSMASKVGEIKNKEQKQVSIIINGQLILTDLCKRPLTRRSKIGFQDQLSLNAVKSIAEWGAH